MKMLFEDDLVDAVVQGCVAGRRPVVPALQIRRFHAERERAYRVLDPDDRGEAFARLHLAWFREWGFEDHLRRIVSRFPGLLSALTALVFRQTRGRNDEAAELYRDPLQQWRGIVALRPARFAQDEALTRFLHHELAHLADMVDPAFGYSPDLAPAGQTPSQLRLTRERYRLLWDVSIDGRLTARGLPTVADEARRRQEFDRGFAFLPETRRAEVFAALWTGQIAGHPRLLPLAADPRGLRGHHAPVPGAACPLCGFPTFHWTTAGHLPAAAQDRIRVDFPAWTEDESVCARCAEMYEAIAGQHYPATVCL